MGRGSLRWTPMGFCWAKGWQIRTPEDLSPFPQFPEVGRFDRPAEVEFDAVLIGPLASHLVDELVVVVLLGGLRSPLHMRNGIQDPHHGIALDALPDVNRLAFC